MRQQPERIRGGFLLTARVTTHRVSAGDAWAEGPASLPAQRVVTQAQNLRTATILS